ncbi:MAG: transcriptional regulator [Pyrinomonadaceae bacterium]
MGEELYRFKDFYLSVDQKRLFEDRDINLSDIQFATLRLLVENPDKKLDKDYLVRKVCPTSRDGRNAIERTITVLREKLNDSRHRPEIIRTEDFGYSFIAEVRKVRLVASDERAATLLEEEEEVEPAAARMAEPPAAVAEPTAGAEAVGADAAAEDEKEQVIGFGELWLSAGKRIRWVVGLGIVLTAVISCGMVFSQWNDINTGANAPPGQVENAQKAQNAVVARAQNDTLALASLPQIFMLLFAIGYGLRGPDGLSAEFGKAAGYENPREAEDARHVAEDALSRYRLYWRGILVFWFCLYCCLVFIKAGTDWKDIPVTLCNNLSTAMFVLCYNVLNQTRKGKRKILDAQWIVWGVVLAAVFLLVEIVPWQLFPAEIDMERLLYACSLVSGVVGAIGMALYMGRLQSKFLGPSPGLVVALYSYTAIQPLFIFLVNVPKSKQVFDAATVTIIAVALVNAALILKCMLFLYVAQLVKSERLLFYFVKVRRTYLNVDRERQEFRKFLQWES